MLNSIRSSYDPSFSTETTKSYYRQIQIGACVPMMINNGSMLYFKKHSIKVVLLEIRFHGFSVLKGPGGSLVCILIKLSHDHRMIIQRSMVSTSKVVLITLPIFDT